MRALTIRQPYADAIAHGEKRVENRSRRTHRRGPVLIHAAALNDPRAILPFGANTARAGWPGVRGAILAVAHITGCHQTDGCCKPWGHNEDTVTWHWELDHVTALAVPVPAKGALGFWTPADDVITAVKAQLPPTTT